MAIESAGTTQPRRGVLFLGTDTEVGKTFQACLLLRALKDRGVLAAAYKPVSSGFPLESHESDPWKLHHASAMQTALHDVCPQVFCSPVAPPVAAKREGKTVDWDLVLSGADRCWAKCDLLVVEAAGGVMSPLSSQHTSLDLAIALGLPIILVAANRLGCVSHCLLALEALKRRDMTVLSVVLNTFSTDPGVKVERAAGGGVVGDLSKQSNRQLLSDFTDTPILDSAPQSLYLPDFPLPKPN